MQWWGNNLVVRQSNNAVAKVNATTASYTAQPTASTHLAATNNNTEAVAVEGTNARYFTSGGAENTISPAFVTTPTGVNFENQTNYVYWSGANLYASAGITLPAATIWGSATIEAARVYGAGASATVVVVANGSVYRSAAGGAWSTVKTSVGSVKATYWNGNNGYLLTDNNVYESTDFGLTWDDYGMSSTSVFNNIAVVDNVVTISNTSGGWFQWSGNQFDPISGSNKLSSFAFNIQAIAAKGNNLMAVGASDVVYYSDGATNLELIKGDAPQVNYVNAAIDDNGDFVCSGY